MIKKIIYFALGFVVGILLSLFTLKLPTPKVKTETITVTDKKCYTVHDTVKIDHPVYSERKVRDTIWVNHSDSLEYLLVEQRKYVDTLYTLWVSGVHPVLDSIHVYNKTEYIEKYIEKTVVTKEKPRGFYVGGAVNSIDGTISPQINAMYQFGNIIVNGTVGMYNRRPVYGVGVNYKIK